MTEDELQVLTIPKLKSLLTSHGISQPPSGIRKQELIDYCMQNLPKSNNSAQPKSPVRSTSVLRRRSASVKNRVKFAPESPEPARPASPVATTPARKSFGGRPSLIGQIVDITPMKILPPPPSKQSYLSKFVKVTSLIALIGGFAAAGFSLSRKYSSPVYCGALVSDNCTPCPAKGVCAAGKLESCGAGFTPELGACVTDNNVRANAANFAIALAGHLRSLRGQKDCGWIESEQVDTTDVHAFLKNQFSD